MHLQSYFPLGNFFQIKTYVILIEMLKGWWILNFSLNNYKILRALMGKVVLLIILSTEKYREGSCDKK